MLINFFQALKNTGVPVSVKDYLVLLEAVKAGLAFSSVDDFYLLAGTCLVKDEKCFDRFDRAFSAWFKDLESVDDIINALVPKDCLRAQLEKQLSDEQKQKSSLWAAWRSCSKNFANVSRSSKNAIPEVVSGSVPGAPHHLAIAATTRREFASVVRAATEVRRRYGRSVTTKIWMIRSRWGPAASRWLYDGCESSPALAPKKNSIWMTLFTVRPATPGCWISRWCPNAITS